MTRGIGLYRSITALWFALVVATLYFALAGPPWGAIGCLVSVAALIVPQTVAFRCKNCGARPGLWLLAVWTLLLDYELYIADVILLRRCPKCEAVFDASHSGRAA
jgi:hypothetical protein